MIFDIIFIQEANFKKELFDPYGHTIHFILYINLYIGNVLVSFQKRNFSIYFWPFIGLASLWQELGNVIE